MTSIGTQQCVFCDQPNYCTAAISDNKSCWCFEKEVPKELLALVPDFKTNKQCICENCIEAFSNDAKAFATKYSK